MADCHNLFEQYNNSISINSSKKQRMKDSKEALRKRIVDFFRANHPDYDPKFYIQGSHKMKTGIRTKDDICDLDDGVYFFKEPDVEPTTVQGWVWDAVNGHTNEIPQHRKKCIRNIFAGDYEIDLPVYYKIDGQDYKLAVKDSGWEASDPKAVVTWFKSHKDENGLLVRTVKYQKGWGDNLRNKMPSGLAMTILATNAKQKIVHNDRDDIYLRDILNEIKKSLDLAFVCFVPAVPFDNLFADYDPDRKQRFLDSLNAFLDDANQALREPNQLKASRLWRKHLGDRFPLGEDKEEDKSRANILIAGSASSKPWCS